jgi:quercetin dioxygenase-like cupin family protein
MKTSFARTVVFLVVAVACVTWARSVAHAQQPAPPVVRTVLLTTDLNVPGYQEVLVEVRIPVGGREGRHTHPGTVIVHVEEGELTLDYDGKPTKAYKAGESFAVEAGKIHEGINRGSAPMRAIAAFVVEKGKPLTTPVALNY